PGHCQRTHARRTLVRFRRYLREHPGARAHAAPCHADGDGSTRPHPDRRVLAPERDGHRPRECYVCIEVARVARTFLSAKRWQRNKSGRKLPNCKCESSLLRTLWQFHSEGSPKCFRASDKGQELEPQGAQGNTGEAGRCERLI